MAVLSSLRNKSLPEGLVVFGEIGLASEIRPVPSGLERLREASKHGFKQAMVPKAKVPKDGLAEIEIVSVSRLVEALRAV